MVSIFRMAVGLVFVSIIGMGSAISVASARPDIFDEWRARYPDSSAGERGCQLCHQLPSGGDGWNPYGYDIRVFFRDVFQSINIDAAFEAVERLDSDQDMNEITNLDEIIQGLDPGWIAGANNRIFFKDDEPLFGVRPPFLVDGETDDTFCFVLPVESGAVASICL